MTVGAEAELKAAAETMAVQNGGAGSGAAGPFEWWADLLRRRPVAS